MECMSEQNLTTKECPLCLESAQRRYQNQVGYQESLQFDIYHCGHCHTAFAWPLKSDSDLYDTIYSQAGSVPGYQRYLTYAQKVLEHSDPLAYLSSQEEIYWAVVQALRWVKPKKSHQRIIEVGCGFGYLTYALRRANYSVVGLDLSKVAVENATMRYGPYFLYGDVSEHSKTHAGQYDTVISTEVIEHIEDIHGMLESFNRLLKPGGTMILTTPNRTPYPKDILWETELPPIHLWWFSEQSIRWMARKMNYSLYFVDFAPWNRAEYKKVGSWQKPYTAIREYRPSRLPRLSAEGKVLGIGDVIVEKALPVNTPIIRRLAWRQIMKKWLQQVGLIGAVDSCRHWVNQQSTEITKSISDRWEVSKPFQKRTTLCAILKKPK